MASGLLLAALVEKRRVEFLDPLRGAAVLAVFLFHALACAFDASALPWGAWTRQFSGTGALLPLLPFTYGWAGVAIFFVVSGFCIHLSFQQGRAGLLGFYARRFFRVYPPYLVALLFFALLLPGTRLHWAAPGSAGQFWSHLWLLHNFGQLWHYGINSAFWSVAVEFQLYLLYPVVLWASRQAGWRRTLLYLGGLEFGLRMYAGIYFTTSGVEAPAWLTYSPIFFWFSWSLGAALGEAWLKQERLPGAETSAWLWGALAVGVYLIKPLHFFSFPLVALCTTSVMAKCLQAGAARWRCPAGLAGHLRTAGLWSYSIYLLHLPLVSKVTRLPEKLWHAPVPPAWLFLLGVLSWFAILPLCGWFHRSIELPSVDLGRWVLRRRKTAPLRAPLAVPEVS